MRFPVLSRQIYLKNEVNTSNCFHIDFELIFELILLKEIKNSYLQHQLVMQLSTELNLIAFHVERRNYCFLVSEYLQQIVFKGTLYFTVQL